MLSDTSVNPYDNFRGELSSTTPFVDGYWHGASFPPWCYVMSSSDDWITYVQRPYFNADGSNSNNCNYNRLCICKNADETTESSPPPPPATPPPPTLPLPPLSPVPSDERWVTTTAGLLDALSSTDVNVIWMAAGIFVVDGCTSPTGMASVDAAIRRAAMLITRSVKIVGAGRDQTIVKKLAGSDSCRVISILGGSSVHVEVEDLTITGGRGFYDGCGVSILNDAHVVMRRVKVWRNACAMNDGGGGIRVMQGHLTMEWCLLIENYADNGGGGLRFSGGAGNTLTLSHNTFVDNLAKSGACELDIMSAVDPTDVQLYNNTFLSGTANCASAFSVSIESRIQYLCDLGQYMTPTPLTLGNGIELSGCAHDCAAGQVGYERNLTTNACSGPCPHGHYCVAATSVPEPCPAGSHLPPSNLGSSLANCIPCTPGTASNATGVAADSCPACAIGSFSSTLGAIECEACPVGGFCATLGAASASMTFERCPGGTYNPDRGATNSSFCRPCAAGHANPIPGSSDPSVCKRCLPGSYAASEGTDICPLCPAGKFSDIAGSTACRNCTSGYLCVEGSSAPQPCPGGTHADQEVLARVGYLSNLTTDCIVCPAGTSCSVGSGQPSPCLPGAYGAQPKQFTCDLCESGTYTPDAGNTACRDCKSGYLCVEGSSAPQPCPGGRHANQTVLNISGFLGSLDECVICPEGTSCSIGSNQPTPCLPGSIAPTPEQETCELCEAGTFQREYGQTACVSCTPGFYCKEGSSEPRPCRAGYVGNATGLSSESQCTPVPRGKWAPLGSAVAEDCPTSGFYCPGTLRDEIHRGAKPVLMPLGQSTETKAVETVEKKMDLDIGIDDFDFEKREALITKLALQYGVPESLITLTASEVPATGRRLQSGGIEVKVTIATADSEGNAVDLEQIQSAVAAVDDTALATSLGEVMGQPVTVVSEPLVVSTAEIEVPFSCPKGKWCTAGMVVECTFGFYNPLNDQVDARACIPCPPYSSTLFESSTSRAECICDTGYYDADMSVADDEALFKMARHNNTDDVVECLVCPIGTACESGSTLVSLPLQKGYYRLDNTSVDVRICPDAQKNCSTTFGTDLCESTSGCQGGTGKPCANNLKGTYCQLCDRSDTTTPVYYRRSDDDGRIASCVECGDTLVNTILVGLGGLAFLALVLLLMMLIRRSISARTIARLRHFNSNFTPMNKLKIVVVFYQLTTNISRVYEVLLPADVNEFLGLFSNLVTLGMTGVATTPLECVGLDGYLPRLLFWMAVPIVVVAVVVLGVCVSSVCRRRTTASKVVTSDGSHGAAFHLQDQEEPERAATIFEKSLQPVLFAMFLLYPKVTNTAFEGFPCYWFAPVGDAPARGWLRADVQIECNTPSHAQVMLVAWTAVGMYPVGILVATTLLLWKASSAIISGKHTPFSRAVSFLYKEYNVTTFWWELMEMLRKFLLVGIFVTLAPGSILQISVGTIVTAAYLMVQLQASPYKNDMDDYLAQGSSFSLLMVFFCSIIYKYDALTASEDLQTKMSIEQKDKFIVPNVLLSAILILSVLGSLLFAGVLVVLQIVVDIKDRMKLRRLKHAATGKWVELQPAAHGDPQAFHLFLSHSWPAAQDRMRIVKARLREALPSCRTFLDVDDLKSGSGTAEVDKSECILVFCTVLYFEKKNSLKELYRAVVQRRPILAMLEPDATQEGGLDQAGVEALITNPKLDRFKLRNKWAEWQEGGELLPAAFDHAPDEVEVRAALFAAPPVEWNRLPHFQDVTIRLIAEKGILHGTGGELYLQGEAATGKVVLPKPFKGRKFHLFCSEFNAGAKEVAEELRDSSVWVTTGKKISVPLTLTTDVSKLASCDHMLVLLDARTWTSGEDTAKLVEHIHQAMRVGVHLNCVHEFPAVVGPPRHECEFGFMFGDDWTPAHLTGGKTNLYKEIALALKGGEWRQPGLVAFASKLAASAAEHKPLDFEVPSSYEPEVGPNPLTFVVEKHGSLPPKKAPERADSLDATPGSRTPLPPAQALANAPAGLEA